MPVRAAHIQLSERLVLTLLLLRAVAAPCVASLAAQATVEHKQVLILFSSDSTSASQIIVEGAMRSTLKNGTSVPVEVYSEYLDAARTSAVGYEKELVGLLRRKYAGKKFDVIFTITDPALQILLRNRHELFPGTPIVFLAIDQRAIAGIALGPNMTGVWGEINFKPNLDLALSLHPKTNRVVVIAGVTDWDKYWTARVKEDFRPYESNLEFDYLIGLTSAELQSELAGLPPNTVVIFVTNVLDKAGNSYENKELLSQISPTSAAPIYGSTDTQLGSGVVGGRLISFEAFGIEGAKVGLRVLAGENAEAIAAHGIPSVALFDWRALRRWSISEESLPPESIVRFRVPSFWDEYKWYAIAVVSALMVQSALIVALVTTRTLRKRAEKERRRAQAEAADQEVRLAGIIGSAMDAVISTDEDHRIILFNNAAEKIFGYTEGEVIGQPLDLLIPEQFRHAHQRHMRVFGQTGATRQLMGTSGGIYGRRANGEEFPIEASISQLELHGRRFYTAIMRDITERRRAQEAASFLAAIVESSDDAVFGETLDGVIMSWNAGAQLIYGYSPDEVKGKNISMLVPADRSNEISRNLERIAGGHSVHNFETIRRRKDGALIYVALTISPVRDGEGHIIAASTVARDITSRKRAEEALRESEERFRNMADTAPVMIWVSGPDKLCTYFNNRWLDFTGRSIEQEPARGWADAIHPDDYEHRLQTYNSAFDLLEPFTIEYRLRRADGEFRWVLESGTARLSPGGEFLGYIGSCIEITERKEAEQALENLSGQLICAREDECARIARDLHDDINQRVALISLELNQLSQGLANSEHGISGMALSILRQTEELSTEVHRMSRDLHPSKLVHLGLVAGLKSLCAELSRGHGLKIEFAHADVPGVLPKDVSLCLYRIVQECLNNVIRHSAAKNAFVELRGGDKEIRLVVSDSGSGFDLESVRSRKGIGLIGMRERLRLVGGTISIESQVATGTSVDVRVPVGRVVEGKEGRLQKSKRRMVTVG